MFRLNEKTELTPFHIDKYIERFRTEEARRNNLWDNYIGKQKILSRTNADPSAPNNKVVNPFCNYITNTMVGYFMGDGVSYKSDNAILLDTISQVNKYNDESIENTELAKDASVFGSAYEMLYIDGDGEIRFKKLPPNNCIAIFDDTVEEELLYFIRYYFNEDIINGNTTCYVEVYSRNDFKLYKKTAGAVELIEEKPHSFGMVPIVIYNNNEEQLGDFETTLPLINAYDNLVSDSINDQDYFTSAYLVLKGMMGTEAEDIAAMKDNRVLLLDNDSAAEWLIKSNAGSNVDTLKNDIASNIFTFSGCPNMSDENFAANASGVAIRYKLMALENITSKKENAFKKGLQRRFELICAILNIMGADYDYRDIEIVFSRNIPSNLSETADVLNKIGHLLSRETQVSLLPLDIDWTAEKKRLDEESVEGFDDYAELLGTENQAE